MAELVLKRADDVVQREVAGEVFLVPISGRLANLQELFALNEVGSWLWARIDDAHDLEELVEGVTREFEVEEPQARVDVQAFLKELVEAGLVCEATSASAR